MSSPDGHIVRAIDTSIPTSTHIRKLEVDLLRAISRTALWPVVEAENVSPGGGIIQAWDTEGRHFKIEITQIGGPE